MKGQLGTNRPPRLVSASLFLLASVFCLYLLCLRGRITSVDEGHVYGTVVALVEHGSWRLPERLNQRDYSRYSVLPSLAGVPGYVVGRVLAGLLVPTGSAAERPEHAAGGGPLESTTVRGQLLVAGASLGSVLATAATAAMLLWGLYRVGLGAGAALAGAAAYAVATLAFPYASSLYVQPMAALWLTWLVLAAVVEMPWALGAAFGLLLAVRMEFALVGLALAFHAWRFHRRPHRTWSALLAGGLLAVGYNVAVNLGRGDPALVGSYGGEGFTTPLWIGLHGLLVSSGKGLVWFAPAAAVGLLLVPRLMRAQGRLGAAVACVTVSLLVMTACWWTWHGGWSWGPRLLLPLMPVLAIPLAWSFDQWDKLEPGWRWLLLLAVASSVAVQIRGVLSDPVGDRTRFFGSLLGGNENESIYIPHTGPLGMRAEGVPDVLVCRLWSQRPQWQPGLVLLCGMLVVGTVGGAGASLRALRIPSGWCLRLLPRLELRAIGVLAGALVLVAAPALAERWLSRGRRVGQPGAAVAEQMRRMQFDPLSQRWTGLLFAPLDGQYRLYRIGPGGTEFVLDGRVVFAGGGEGGRARSLRLRRGCHALAVCPSPYQPPDMLFWTTPGNGHYKEPIPAVYLTGPAFDWPARAAIVIHEWRWLVWLVYGLWVLCLLPPRRAGDR